MRTRTTVAAAALLVAAILAGPTSVQGQAKGSSDPLPSWNDGPAKKAILDFVAKVAKEGGPDFVPVAERIAVFDNDGTLWPENPLPFQLAFVFDELDRLAPQHPEWKNEAVVQAALKRDIHTLLESAAPGLLKLFGLTHAGMTTDEFKARVEGWLAKAKHPRYNKPYRPGDAKYQLQRSSTEITACDDINVG